MGPETARIAWKLQSGLPQDVLAQKPALLMDCEEMFDELQRRVSTFAKAIVENKMWKIGAVNVFWFIIQPVSSSRNEEDTVTAPLDRPVLVLRSSLQKRR